LAEALSVPVHAYDPLAGAVPAIPEDLRGRFAGPSASWRARLTIRSRSTSPRRGSPKHRDPGKKRLLIAVAAAVVLLSAGAALGYVVRGIADTRVEEMASAATT